MRNLSNIIRPRNWPTHRQPRCFRPQLGEVFYRLQQARKIWQPGTITVPVYKRKIEIPYAYKNGVVNLVKPHVFPANKRAETPSGNAGRQRRPDPKASDRRGEATVDRRLDQETAEQAGKSTSMFEPLFNEYGVRLIRPDDVDAFAAEVEQSAH